MRLTIKREQVAFWSLVSLYGGASLLELNVGLLGVDELNILRFLLIVLGLGGMLFCMIGTEQITAKIKKPYYDSVLVAWLIFSATVVLTGLAKADMGLAAEGFWRLLGASFFFFYVIPFVTQAMPLDLFFKAFMVGHLPYLVTFYFAPLSDAAWAYYGIWNNPNDFGVYALTPMLSAVYFAHHADGRHRLRNRVFWMAVTFSFLALILISGSRTALTAGVAMLCLSVALSQWKRWKKILFFLSWPLWVSLVLWSNLPIFDAVKSKFSDNAASATLLSGREYIWQRVLNEASWLGHDKDYFSAGGGLGGHNSFVDVLGVHGIFALIAVAWFFCVVMFVYLKNRRYWNDTFRFAFAEVFLVFFILSCGEGMLGALGHGFQMIFLTMVGIQSYQLRLRNEVEHG